MIAKPRHIEWRIATGDRQKLAYIQGIEAKLCNEFKQQAKNIDPISERLLIIAGNWSTIEVRMAS